MASLSDLERNDLAAAVGLYQERMKANVLSPSFVRSLLMLQDDPSTLIAAIDEINPGSRNPSPPPLIRMP